MVYRYATYWRKKRFRRKAPYRRRFKRSYPKRRTYQRFNKRKRIMTNTCFGKTKACKLFMGDYKELFMSSGQTFTAYTYNLSFPPKSITQPTGAPLPPGQQDLFDHYYKCTVLGALLKFKVIQNNDLAGAQPIFFSYKIDENPVSRSYANFREFCADNKNRIVPMNQPFNYTGVKQRIIKFSPKKFFRGFVIGEPAFSYMDGITPPERSAYLHMYYWRHVGTNAQNWMIQMQMSHIVLGTERLPDYAEEDGLTETVETTE